MTSDPNKPFLRLTPLPERGRPIGEARRIPRPDHFARDHQDSRFSPKFDRLAELLDRDPAGLELRSDPTALAPERMLVFEVRGALADFARAVSRIPGLELIDEEELESDGPDKAPVAYLMVPDMRALRELEALWRRWLRDDLRHGETGWRELFGLLRDLRVWGPQDRVQAVDGAILTEEIEGRAAKDPVRLEIELVFSASGDRAKDREEKAAHAVHAQGGRIISRAMINEIAYHAVLVDLPVEAVQRVIDGSTDGIAALDSVMHIRPQSVADSIEVADTNEGRETLVETPLGEPILAILDGVPVAAHRLLADHLVVDDQFDLEPNAPVAERHHGTAMASLVVHGDLRSAELPLPRRVHFVPVLGAGDAFPSDRLIVDIIHSAVVAMREGNSATAPGVLIVNLSLGNSRRPFHGQLSPWARLLDRLAYHYGLLFFVSAGNWKEPFAVRAFSTNTMFEDAAPDHRAHETLRALGAIVADRRLLSPAETVNGLTVGACNTDSVPAADRAVARAIVDPYGERRMSNPSCALGPGFALSVKPDILLPGSREHLRTMRTHTHIEVVPAPVVSREVV